MSILEHARELCYGRTGMDLLKSHYMYRILHAQNKVYRDVSIDMALTYLRDHWLEHVDLAQCFIPVRSTKSDQGLKFNYIDPSTIATITRSTFDRPIKRLNDRSVLCGEEKGIIFTNDINLTGNKQWYCPKPGTQLDIGIEVTFTYSRKDGSYTEVPMWISPLPHWLQIEASLTRVNSYEGISPK